MNEWVQTSDLTEVLQHGKLTPTWRQNEGTKKAMLDRVFCYSRCLSHTRALCTVA
jgi:hypothetical protein